MKYKKGKKYVMESSVTFPQSTESANMNMSNVGQKPELGIPNPCAVKDNEFMSPAVSAEGTNLWR